MYLCSYRGSSAPPVLLLNVTLTNPRNSVSEGMSLLTFTRCLQIVSAASSVSALYQCAGWSWKITAPTLWGCDRSNSALQLVGWFISVYLDYVNYLPAASSCVLVLIDCNKIQTNSADSTVMCKLSHKGKTLQSSTNKAVDQRVRERDYESGIWFEAFV